MDMRGNRIDSCVLGGVLLWAASCTSSPEPPAVAVAGESRAGESRAGESRAGESRAGESRAGESRADKSISADLTADNVVSVFTEDPADDPMMAEAVRATGKQFVALDAGPFRLICQGSESRARSISMDLITPACSRFRRQFFKSGPKENVRIILFQGAEAFRAGAEALSGELPDTPYGYYSDHLGAVIMDFKTGGGTLVHELVHTFAELDFPTIPAWLNEGIGSLFECSSFADDRISGLPNWRLPGLQHSLNVDPAGTTGILERVIATNAWEFYGEGSGTNYAVARYLCYDLQQKGLLERFYKTFRDGDGADPTGRAVLERILGQTLEEYEPGWRERTLKLEYR